MRLWKLMLVLAAIIAASAVLSARFLSEAARMRAEARAGREQLEALRQEQRAEEAARRADSLDRYLTTADLAFHEVHGRVERIEYDGYTVTLDREGNLTSPAFDADSIERGTSRLLTTHLEYSRHGNHYSIRLFYDHHDRLSRKSATVTGGEGGTYNLFTRYENYTADARGNWVSRRAVITRNGTSAADSLSAAVATLDSIERRIIIYYK